MAISKIDNNALGTITSIDTGSATGLTLKTNGVTALTIDGSQNVGIGTIPSAWSSAYKALQLNTQPAVWGSSDALFLTVNQFQNSWGSNRYIANGFATQYRQDTGQHQWHTAPSGTAGNAITFTQAMTLDASGNVGIGTIPSAWYSSYKGIQFFGGSLGTHTAARNIELIANGVHSGSGAYSYLGAASASMYAMDSGQHQWHIAPSGTAGNAITFTQAMTLDAAGNVGIGTGASLTKKLQVVTDTAKDGILISGSTNPRLQVIDTTNSVTLEMISGDSVATIRTDTNHDLLFGTYGLERMRIASTGDLKFGTASSTASASVQAEFKRAGNSYTLQLTNDESGNGAGNNMRLFQGWNSYIQASHGLYLDPTGALGVTKGITFPATQVASSDANTLDDYEEGTWTPVLGGFSSVSYSDRQGTYTKIGNMVYVFWDFTVSSKTGTGNGFIQGLPFVVSPSLAGYSVASHRASDLFNANGVVYGQLKGFAERGATYICLQVDQSTTVSFGFGAAVGYNATGRSTGYVVYQAA